MPKIGQRSEGGDARQLRDLRAAQIEIAADPEPLGQLRDVRTIQIKLTADAEPLGQRRYFRAAQIEPAADAKSFRERIDLGAVQIEIAAEAQPLRQHRDIIFLAMTGGSNSSTLPGVGRDRLKRPHIIVENGFRPPP